MGLIQRRTESEPVESTKQKGWLAEIETKKVESIRSRSRTDQQMKIPQIMGGGPLEHGGDGTGFAGGIELNYWVEMIKNLPVLRSWLGREPIAGQDYPTAEQMEKARLFAKSRKQ